MRPHLTPITVYPIPFNQGLPGERRDRSPIDRLLPMSVRSELQRKGWLIAETTTEGCVLRKSVDDYAAKAYVVRVRRVDADHVEAQGELTLHSMSCGCICRTLSECDRLHEQFWSMLDATEALNVFGDDEE